MDNENLSSLFWAFGDATRRSIMDLLAQEEQLTVSEIAAHFPHLVRSGISKHLMELRRLRLVCAEKKGRECHYRINEEAINALLRPWVSKYEKYWDDRLLRLKAAAEQKEMESEHIGTEKGRISVP